MNCRKCGANVPLLNFTTDVRSAVSEWVRKRDRLQAAKELRHRTAIELADAKSIVFHISREGGNCHRCSEYLSVADTTIDCSKCGSLNLVW